MSCANIAFCVDCLTTALLPLKPFPLPVPDDAQPTVEVAEFQSANERDVHPYATYINHLFVYPLALNFESQKLFSRARNLSVVVELRESDAEGSGAVPCIYGRPPDHHTHFVERIACPVLHHNTTPTWYEELKLQLPLQLTAQHHLLFSFVHVSCDLSKKRDPGAAMESPVGFAWLPLLQKGRINVDEQCLAVAATLPAGYLSIQPLGLGRGVSDSYCLQYCHQFITIALPFIFPSRTLALTFSGSTPSGRSSQQLFDCNPPCSAPISTCTICSTTSTGCCRSRVLAPSRPRRRRAKS